MTEDRGKKTDNRTLRIEEIKAKTEENRHKNKK